MPLLHDHAYRKSIHDRVDLLTSAAPRRWGRMTVDQMVWHVRRGLDLGLERITSTGYKSPIPLPMLLVLAQYFPIPREKAPTIPAMEANLRRDLAAEVTRFHESLEAFARKPLDSSWPTHPVFERLTGKQWSRIQANHVNHHLRQFGV